MVGALLRGALTGLAVLIATDAVLLTDPSASASEEFGAHPVPARTKPAAKKSAGLPTHAEQIRSKLKWIAKYNMKLPRDPKKVKKELTDYAEELVGQREELAKEIKDEEVRLNKITNKTHRGEHARRLARLRNDLREKGQKAAEIAQRYSDEEITEREMEKLLEQKAYEQGVKRKRQIDTEAEAERRLAAEMRELEKQEEQEEVDARRKLRQEAHANETKEAVMRKSVIDREHELHEQWREERRIMAKEVSDMKEKLENERRARALAERRAEDEMERQEYEAQIKVKRARRERLDAYRAEDLARKHETSDQKEVRRADERKLRNIFFEEILGDTSMYEMMDMLKHLRKIVEGEGFVGNVTEATYSVQISGARYVKLARNKVRDYVNNVSATADQELLPSLASFLNESLELFMAHKQEVEEIKERVRTMMPAESATKVFPMLNKVFPEIKPFGVSTEDLAKASFEEACAKLAETLATIGNYSDLSAAKDVLNTTGRMVPMLSSLMPDLTLGVTSLAETISKVGQVEIIALEQTSKSFVTSVGPVLNQRLHCDKADVSEHAAAYRGTGLGLAATLLVLTFPQMSVV